MFDFVNSDDYHNYKFKKIYRFNQFLLYKNYNITFDDYIKYCQERFRNIIPSEYIEYYNSYQLQMQINNRLNDLLGKECNSNFKFNYNIN